MTTQLARSLEARQQALDALGLSPHRLVKRLPGGRWKAPTDPLATAQPDSADDGKLYLRYVISSLSQDRDGDVLVPQGLTPWLWSYERAPVVLLGHDQDNPIGLSRPEGGPLDVQIAEAQITAGCHFAQDSEHAVQAYALAKAGVLGMASVGFIGHLAMHQEQQVDNSDLPPGVLRLHDWPGLRFVEWEMAEWSILAIGSNRDAVQIREAMQKRWDGKPLVEPLQRMLSPLAGPRKPWSNGMALGPGKGQQKTAVQSLLLARKQFPTLTDAVDWARKQGWDASEVEATKAGWVLVQGGAPACTAGDCREELDEGVHAIRCSVPCAKGCSDSQACSCGKGDTVVKPVKKQKGAEANGNGQDDDDLLPGAKALKGLKLLCDSVGAAVEEANVRKFFEDTGARAQKCSHKSYPDHDLGWGKAGDMDDEEEEDKDVDVNVEDDDDEDDDDEEDDEEESVETKQRDGSCPACGKVSEGEYCTGCGAKMAGDDEDDMEEKAAALLDRLAKATGKDF